MASEQVLRDNTTSEREVQIEKVPKITSHFESLTVHVKDADESGKDRTHDSRDRSANIVGGVGGPGKAGDRDVGGDQKQREKEQDQHEPEQQIRGPYAVGKFEMSGSEQERPSAEVKGREERPSTEVKGREEHHEQEKSTTQSTGKVEGRQQQEQCIEVRGKGGGHKEQEQSKEMRGKEEGRGQQKQPSLEEISKLRGTAQQSSMEAIKAAEERYNQVKEEARHKLGGATEYAAEKGSQVKDTFSQGAQSTSQLVAEKGSQAKDTALEKGSQAKDTLLQGAQRTSQLVAEKGSQAKDTALEKGSQAKDTLYNYTVPKAEQAKYYALEKASQAKDIAIDSSKKVASYTEEKAAAAKDVTVESGKGASEYAGNVAADVKDKAVVAGWSTAHSTTEKAMEGTGVMAKVAQYTAEKAVEGTKAAARAVQEAAGYAGHKAVEIASKPLGAAKETVVATGESMKDYTARKKEEAEREYDAKQSQRGQDTEWSYQGGGETEQSYQGGDNKGESLTRKAEEKIEEYARPVASTIRQTLGGVEEQGKQMAEQHEGENRGGGAAAAAAEMLSAIGETVVEIAETTKDFMVGERSIGEKIVGHDDRSSQVESGKHEEARREQTN
ncbi:hypothetical protein ACOSP7_002252 [Xanthoceras sorbifolium]